MDITLSLNDYWRVKPTPRGLAIHKEYWEKLYADVAAMSKGRRPAPTYKPPVLDKDGYFRDQGWAMMEIFGPHMQMGLAPISMIIVVEKEINVTVQ